MTFNSFMMEVSIQMARKGGANLDEYGHLLTAPHSPQYVHDRHGHACSHCVNRITHYKCSGCGQWICQHCQGSGCSHEK